MRVPQETNAGSIFTYQVAREATIRAEEVKEPIDALRRVPLALALLFALLGCASGAGTAATRSLPVVHASDGQDGGKVTLRRGQKLRVVLHSTYWEFKAVSAPGGLRLVGEPLVARRPGCVPGQGCGTVTATYVARTGRLRACHRRAYELRRGHGLHRRRGELQADGRGARHAAR